MKNSVKYRVNESCVSCEGREHVTYGIDAVCNGDLLLQVDDISENYDIIDNIVNKINMHNLELNHLHDIIDDIL